MIRAALGVARILLHDDHTCPHWAALQGALAAADDAGRDDADTIRHLRSKVDFLVDQRDRAIEAATGRAIRDITRYLEDPP